MGEGILWLIILALCAAIFGAIGAWALTRKDPMHFWSGSTVPPEEIRDIPAYNRACGAMWLVCAGAYLALGFAGLVSVGWAAVATGIFTLAAIPALILVYKGIYNKYKT